MMAGSVTYLLNKCNGSDLLRVKKNPLHWSFFEEKENQVYKTSKLHSNETSDVGQSLQFLLCERF